jgi:hypothetical protein
MRARMRSGASWHDVCILNLSKRGLGIRAAEPPQRGTYAEIRRGSQVVVVRVMWAKGHRAGLHSQDAIALHALVREDLVNDCGTLAVERRRAPRSTQEQHESSRLFARIAEFACFALAAFACGLVVLGTVEHALALPTARVRAALDG